MKHTIGIIVGSLRRESYNRRLAHALMKFEPAQLTFKFIGIADLPLYNQDDDDHPAETVKRLKAEVRACDGILFVTPEYNRAMPGVLKNAIDHASRPYGQSAWAGKPAGVIGISVGATGTSMSQQHLRNTLAYLDMPTLGQPEIYLQYKDGMFDSAGNIAEEGLRKLLQNWLARFTDWVGRHSLTVSHGARAHA